MPIERRRLDFGAIFRGLTGSSRTQQPTPPTGIPSRELGALVNAYVENDVTGTENNQLVATLQERVANEGLDLEYRGANPGDFLGGPTVGGLVTHAKGVYAQGYAEGLIGIATDHSLNPSQREQAAIDYDSNSGKAGNYLDEVFGSGSTMTPTERVQFLRNSNHPALTTGAGTPAKRIREADESRGIEATNALANIDRDFTPDQIDALDDIFTGIIEPEDSPIRDAGAIVEQLREAAKEARFPTEYENENGEIDLVGLRDVMAASKRIELKRKFDKDSLADTAQKNFVAVAKDLSPEAERATKTILERFFSFFPQYAADTDIAGELENFATPFTQSAGAGLDTAQAYQDYQGTLEAAWESMNLSTEVFDLDSTGESNYLDVDVVEGKLNEKLNSGASDFDANLTQNLLDQANSQRQQIAKQEKYDPLHQSNQIATQYERSNRNQELSQYRSTLDTILSSEQYRVRFMQDVMVQVGKGIQKRQTDGGLQALDMHLIFNETDSPRLIGDLFNQAFRDTLEATHKNYYENFGDNPKSPEATETLEPAKVLEEEYNLGEGRINPWINPGKTF